MIKKVDEMHASMQFMNDKFETALKELIEAKKENVEFKETVNLLKSKVINLETQVSELKNQQLRDNIEISGVPCRSDENCKMVALNVIKQVRPETIQDDIVEVHRMGNANDLDGNPRMHRNLLVQLKERKVRDEIYKNKKKLRGVDTVRMGLSSESQRIYINENLSRESKALFKKANDLRKEKRWKYIWTSFGIILVRKDDESRVLRVCSEMDLAKLI